jgi:hypothetical protein
MRHRFAILFALLAATNAPALELYVQAQRFTWEEHDQNGQLLLEEQGPLLGLGLVGESRLPGELTWRSRLEGFVGEVDYDGSTVLGAPVRTTTAYYGGKGETDLRWNLATADIFDTGPLGGLSTRGWLRRLDNSQDSNGYDEGLVDGVRPRGLVRPLARASRLVARRGSRRAPPLYNSARYSLTGADGDGNVSVEPGREITTEAALILRRATWSIGLAYENFAFGRSDPEPLPPFEIFQPESKGDAWSLRVGVAF